MSSNYLRLIPSDPNFMPEEQAQIQARAIFETFVPKAYEISSRAYENVIFVDAGVNYERISCPFCGAVLNHNWWINEMNWSYNKTNFTDLTTSTPCCEIRCTLNDLRYEWPMGFPRFIIEAIDPGTDIEETQFTILNIFLNVHYEKYGLTMRLLYAKRKAKEDSVQSTQMN